MWLRLIQVGSGHLLHTHFVKVANGGTAFARLDRAECGQSPLASRRRVTDIAIEKCARPGKTVLGGRLVIPLRMALAVAAPW
jgi:hypothetical protein